MSRQILRGCIMACCIWLIIGGSMRWAKDGDGAGFAMVIVGVLVITNIVGWLEYTR